MKLEPREYYSDEGRVQSAEEVAKLQYEISVEESWISENEFHDLIDQIEFNDLKDVFREIISGTGVQLHFAGREKIHVTKKVGGGGVHPLTDSIVIHPKQLEQVEVPRDLYHLYALYFICHEESHYVTRTIYQGLYDAYKENTDKITFKGGYARSEGTAYRADGQFLGVKRDQMAFTQFEEGLTDRMGLQAFVQYLRRHPEYASDTEIESFLEFLSRTSRQYLDNAYLVSAFIARVSQETGFDRLAVWHALIRDKVRAEGFDDPELSELTAAYIRPDFLDQLRNLNERSDKKNFKKLLEILELK